MASQIEKQRLREIRFDNVRHIHQAVGDEEFTKRMQLTPGRKNQLLKRHGFLGDRVARSIEGAFGFKPRWLDQENPSGVMAGDRDITEDYIAARLNELLIMVDNMPDREARAKMQIRCLNELSAIKTI